MLDTQWPTLVNLNTPNWRYQAIPKSKIQPRGSHCNEPIAPTLMQYANVWPTTQCQTAKQIDESAISKLRGILRENPAPTFPSLINAILPSTMPLHLRFAFITLGTIGVNAFSNQR